jgi:hypothetical protein
VAAIFAAVTVVVAVPSVITALPIAIKPRVVSRTIVAITGIITGVIIIAGRRRRFGG